MKRKSARSRDSYLLFGAPAIEEAEIQEVVETMRSGWLGTGPRVAQFESDIRAYKGCRHAVAVSSCTAALNLSMLALGLAPGDEVITTPLTFCATVNAIIHAGARPVLADIDPVSMNIDPAQVEAKITSRTRAVIPVHFAGRPCAMDALSNIAIRYGLAIVEDCAHAIESEYKGRKVGTVGNLGCLSFYVTKNITTGEGGMVITDDGEKAARIKILALHGMTMDAWERFKDEGYKHYAVVEAGFKYNMMDLQAAIGIHQLRRIETCWRRREQIWQYYSQALAGFPVILPAAPEPHTRHAYHLYTVLIDENRAGLSRDAFLQAMDDQKIGVGVHYRSIPEHPYYQEVFGWRPEEYPNATRAGRQTVSLPLSANLTDGDVADVVAAVTGALT